MKSLIVSLLVLIFLICPIIALPPIGNRAILVTHECTPEMAENVEMDLMNMDYLVDSMPIYDINQFSFYDDISLTPKYDLIVFLSLGEKTNISEDFDEPYELNMHLNTLYNAVDKKHEVEYDVRSQADSNEEIGLNVLYLINSNTRSMVLSHVSTHYNISISPNVPLNLQKTPFVLSNNLASNPYIWGSKTPSPSVKPIDTTFFNSIRYLTSGCTCLSEYMGQCVFCVNQGGENNVRLGVMSDPALLPSLSQPIEWLSQRRGLLTVKDISIHGFFSKRTINDSHDAHKKHQPSHRASEHTTFFIGEPAKISVVISEITGRSKEKLGGKVALDLLRTLRNISISPSSSTRSSIFTLIKPYIRDWLRIYNDSECYGQWMAILSKITFLSDNSTPNKSMCSEAWPLFHPVLDVVKREFVGDKIVGDYHEYVIFFFSHLCCDPAHAVEVYDNVKDLLDGWFTVIKKEEHEWGIKYWSRLISMLSTVPSLVPHISPKYDTKMEWCKNNGAIDGDYSRYSRNCRK
ncbi:hypothetical protein ADUPG1_014176 [Aduncisulcus paluster]|uniref:Uncharacterized protein n=1 Tax=Aduncisulcus paluster TaxID=2918883 RepID=A0ABQ5KB34_9EUKA|nr:hypothetical protein ADUPG1_014176 [Aduncisulcus paluster]